MSHDNDPLWDPRAGGDDAQLQRMERLLSRYGARLRGIDSPPLAVRRRRNWSRIAAAAVAASICAVALLYSGLRYRLDWSSGQPWSVSWSGQDAGAIAVHLRPGELVRTGDQQRARIDVARIGQLSLSPDSALRLTETGEGRHRVRLESGHLQARIWAPPGYFGVSIGAAEVIDIGCEFDLWRHEDGSGRVVVSSGWVAFRVGQESVLVPQGYALDYGADAGRTPLRVAAEPAFVTAVRQLDAALAAKWRDNTAVVGAADRLAGLGSASDAFSLLSLLSRHRDLARTGLYSRLAQDLGVSALDPRHRARWISGDNEAVNEWWSLYPSQPKRWWRNWQDALPWSDDSDV